jgi:hemolysin III
MFPSKTKPERTADFAIHAVSLIGFAIAAVFLLAKAIAGGGMGVAIAVCLYVIAALFSVGISFAYHLLPRHEWRATLRRWDHAAIYLVIASTFSPLLVMVGSTRAHVILGIIWLLALVGVWFKLAATTIDTRWSLISYLGLGAFALFAMPDFWASLPRYTTAAIALGGLFYCIGTVFYRNKALNFRYPIWHAWGTMGGTSFFAAIWIALGS